jgi:hypothetical protein
VVYDVDVGSWVRSLLCPDVEKSKSDTNGELRPGRASFHG